MQDILKLSALLLFTTALSAQTSFQLQGSYGKFFSHSDNEIEITAQEDFDKAYGFGAVVQHGLNRHYSLQMEISYHRSSEFEVLSVFATDITGSQVGENTATLKQASIPLDLTLLFHSGALGLGAGASIANIQRTVHLESTLPGVDPTDDRLSSVAIGFNGLIDYQIPLNSSKKIHVIPAIKLRYLKTVWFDKKGRNLDNYEQNYTVGQVVIGLRFKL